MTSCHEPVNANDTLQSDHCSIEKAMLMKKRLFLKTAALGLGLPAIPVLAATPAAAGPRAGYFPNVELTSHTGEKLRFYDDVVKGEKRVIINMMYTVCTNTCPPNTANLVQVQEMLGDRLGRDVFMYSLSLRPDFDTPQALRAYMKQYGVKPGWTFLTGRAEEVDILRRKLGFYDKDPVADADISQHTGMVRMGREAYDRWSMMPTMVTPKQIVNSVWRL
jgi:protein SCO1/2